MIKSLHRRGNVKIQGEVDGGEKIIAIYIDSNAFHKTQNERVRLSEIIIKIMNMYIYNK